MSELPDDLIVARLRAVADAARMVVEVFGDRVGFGEAAVHALYLAPDGSEISRNEWSRLFETRLEDMSDESWWRKQTKVGDKTVSTVWIGLNHQFAVGPPLFWETMICEGDEYGDEAWRYSSREDALANHGRIVQALRETEQQ
ncbi:MAG: hypothetical protein J2P16_00265 [Mycobacterium sp.]|nr:hypothetical protein [Mycobacterium sp.]